MRQNSPEPKGELAKPSVTGGDFNAPCSVIDTFSRRKINKHIVFLNSTINQFDQVGIYRKLYLTIAQYTFFSS